MKAGSRAAKRLMDPPATPRHDRPRDEKDGNDMYTGRMLPFSARTPLARDVKGALKSLRLACAEDAQGRRGASEARLGEAVRVAGTVALDRTASDPAGARLDAAFGLLATDHTAPWPLASSVHHKDLLRTMVHLARARLALIRGRLPQAMGCLGAARALLDRIQDAEEPVVWCRIALVLLALDEAERRLAESVS